ncbi:hypothetical protein [Oxalobacter formigenes]
MTHFFSSSGLLTCAGGWKGMLSSESIPRGIPYISDSPTWACPVLSSSFACRLAETLAADIPVNVARLSTLPSKAVTGILTIWFPRFWYR